LFFKNEFILKHLLLLLLTISLFTCKEDKGSPTINEIVDLQEGQKINLKYAEGFEIFKTKDYTILTIKSPWPESNEEYKYYLSNSVSAINMKLQGSMNTIKAIDIKTPIEKIVVTSTTHIPALELLEVEKTLVGFPGTDYISSEKTRIRIDNKQIRELGKNEGINTEVLLDLNPNVVVAFGVDGKSKSLETIKKANIPVIYNGDWVEKSPLAKAEWIKFFGALYNKEKEADSIFNKIETDYNKAKLIALNAKNKPTILCGAMHKDVWYLPNGTSTEAQFLKDANTNYLWSETKEKGSIALNFEVVFSKGKTANLWLSPSYYSSKEALIKSSTHYSKFDAFKNDAIYTFSNTTGKSGGVLYYELGTARPDLVLKDIIKISHPELLQDYKPFFFKKLE